MLLILEYIPAHGTPPPPSSAMGECQSGSAIIIEPIENKHHLEGALLATDYKAIQLTVKLWLLENLHLADVYVS